MLTKKGKELGNMPAENFIGGFMGMTKREAFVCAALSGVNFRGIIEWEEIKPEAKKVMLMVDEVLNILAEE